MISRKNFTDDALALTSGRYAMDIEQAMEQPEAPADPMATDKPEGPQMAALGGTLSKHFRRLLKQDTPTILQNSRQNTAPSEAPVEDIRAVLADYSERKQMPEGPEADRIMTNLDTSEDLGYMLEVMGSDYEPDVRTWESLQDGTSDYTQIEKELAPLLQGTQSGLMTDKQMLGMRRMLVTMGEETTELANKIIAGDATPETMALYQQRFRQMESLYSFSRGQATEIARALNQQKMLAKSLNSGSLHDLAASNNAFGTPDQIQQHAQLFMSQRNKKGLGQALAHMSDKANSIVKASVEYWKNNILSGVETHAVNISSTALTNVWENVIIRPTAASIGTVRGAVTGDKDRVYMAESMSAMAGGYVGLKSGIRLMANVLKTGDSQFGMAKDEAHGEIHKLLGNKVGDAATMSFRLLRAEDELAKSVAFTQQIYALATRDGIMNGLSGDELAEHIAGLVENPTTKMYDESMEYAKHLTFTQDEVGGAVGTMAKMAKTLVGRYPIFGFVMPFINTPANLLNYALESSILAPVAPSVHKGLKQGGAAADIALAKITTGVSLSAAAYQLYSAGVLTGDGPDDWKRRKHMENATGWKQQGIKLGDSWYSLDRADPFAASLALVTNSFDKATYAKSPEEAEKWMSHAFYTLAEVSMDSIWMSSFADFIEVANGDRDANKFLANYATGFVPYSGFVKSLKKGVDPQTRISDLDKLSYNVEAYYENKLKAGIPGLSSYVRPARYWDGSLIIPEGGLVANAINPIKSAEHQNPSPVDRELLRSGVIVDDPDSLITLGPATISLLSLDEGEGIFYDAYIKRVGQSRKMILDEIVSRDSYLSETEGPGGRRSQILGRGLASAQQAGLGIFLTEDFMPLLEEYPHLRTQVTEQLGADPVEFISNLVEQGLLGQDLPLKAVIDGVPIRAPIPVPGERPLTNKQEIMPRF